eukprot:CAMPEP_0171669456 /NCGR_PEP_ID=MMETSP0990-20121206/50016_1 /TAXON_ID=483369 /ORGANISM="non described non described, Strain CCMP2098" /LENGTH=80 /DNA_ID=CAMNT_0012253781 /DNA_START=734 /DNA_END=973 /DNA_ORIENTATION=-
MGHLGGGQQPRKLKVGAAGNELPAKIRRNLGVLKDFSKELAGHVAQLCLLAFARFVVVDNNLVHSRNSANPRELTTEECS